VIVDDPAKYGSGWAAAAMATKGRRLDMESTDDQHIGRYVDSLPLHRRNLGRIRVDSCDLWYYGQCELQGILRIRVDWNEDINQSAYWSTWVYLGAFSSLLDKQLRVSGQRHRRG